MTIQVTMFADPMNLSQMYFPNHFFPTWPFFVCLNEGPRNMQMFELLGKAVMLVITLHLILQKSKLTCKNNSHPGRRNETENNLNTV